MPTVSTTSTAWRRAEARLRAWFAALYEVLLGQSQGPRFGSFAALFGTDNTAAMIRAALRGEFLA